MPAINETLQQERYRIIQPLGQNGVGAIYEAYDNVRETKVLFKEISVNLRKVTTLTQQEELRRRFADEAKILTGMKHESLLPVYDFFSEIDRHYLVMELADGNNLSELIEQRQKPFSLADVSNWIGQMLDALQYLHAQMPPVIHRDIKPQNIKLTSDGKIKLALSIQNPDLKVNAVAANQTLHYLPLEQIWLGLDSASQKVIANSFDEKSERILEQPADARSDIYALAATVYQLLTARLPIDALERSIDILEGKPDPLARPDKINPAIPPEISDILMKALEIKRENRFDSAVIMRQAWRTAFVHLKEREAPEATEPDVIKLDEDLLEIPFAEQTERRVAERRITAPSKSETEAEKTRETELIKRLQEAEARRLEAERRAAEAEKRLAEKQSKALSANESPATIIELPEVIIETPPVTVAAPDVIAYSAEQAQTADEFNDLFAVPQKDNGAFRKMFAVAASLVILCGAAFGVWFLMQSNTVEPNQATSSQMSLTETTKPAPSVEPTPAPSVETTPETSSVETTSLPTDSTETTAVSPSLKNKPVAPAAVKAKKQTLPAARPAEKKAVTVDDLINDNN
ncbi:MAG TPA: protein kinase [Pyrinomonadaceae bacterium]|jgi:serine/threonine protein kinase